MDPDPPGAPLNVVCGFWSDFDLDFVRRGLDEAGMKVAQFQEESTANRRALADATRNFKRGASEEVLKGVQGLLRSYQEEVDRLTKRAKHSETSFLEIYQKLYEAPDPAPTLLESLEAATLSAEREAAMTKLEQELSDFRTEAKHIKNQGLTIRRLEDQVSKLEAAAREAADAAATSRREEVEGEAAQELADLRRREADLTAALSEEQMRVRGLERQFQVAQNKLFALQSAHEERVVVRDSEADITSAELEALQSQVMGLEAENAALKQGRAAGSRDQETALTQANERARQAREEVDLQAQLVTSLRDELARLQSTLQDDVSTHEASMVRMRAALEAQEAHASALTQQLQVRPTEAHVAALKLQLTTLQAAVGVNAGNSGETSPSGAAASGGGGRTLEALLMEKTRRMEHTITTQKLDLADLHSNVEQLNSQLHDATSTLSDKVRLIERLEADLSATEAAVAGGTPRAEEGWAGAGDGQEDGGQTMLTVLCTQRDRYKAKAEQLEEEAARLRSELTHTQSGLTAARADNVALVERIRFVQGYGAGSNNQKVSQRTQQAEAKYSGAYEEAVDPFKEFQGRERESRRKALGITDQAVYSVGQLVLQNKYARTGAFFYALIMHALVFCMMTSMSHHHSSLMHEAHVLCASQHHVELPGRLPG